MFRYETTVKFDKEYNYFRQSNSYLVSKIDKLIADTGEHPRSGIGRPERLRHYQGAMWSRRIDQKNRLVYRIIGEDRIRFETCEGHYGDH